MKNFKVLILALVVSLSLQLNTVNAQSADSIAAISVSGENVGGGGTGFCFYRWFSYGSYAHPGGQISDYREDPLFLTDNPEQIGYTYKGQYVIYDWARLNTAIQPGWSFAVHGSESSAAPVTKTFTFYNSAGEIIDEVTITAAEMGGTTNIILTEPRNNYNGDKIILFSYDGNQVSYKAFTCF